MFQHLWALERGTPEYVELDMKIDELEAEFRLFLEETAAASAAMRELVMPDGHEMLPEEQLLLLGDAVLYLGGDASQE